MPSTFFPYKAVLQNVHCEVFRIVLLLVLMSAAFSCQEKKKPTPADDYSKEFDAIYHDSRIYDASKVRESMHYLDSAFGKLTNATRNDTFRYYSLHFIYDRKVTHNAAGELLYADSMLAIANKCISEPQYVNFLSEANFAKGDAYFDLQEYNDAYKCYYEGYFLGKNHLNDEILAEYTYRMAMITFKQSRFAAAANYFKESYKLSLSIKDGFGTFYQRQELLNNIGESYLYNGDLDSSSLYFDNTLAFIDASADKYKEKFNLLQMARAVTIGDQGIISYHRKQYTLAENQFKQSIAINLQKFYDNNNAESVEINLAHIYLDLNRDKEFTDLMQNIRQQLDSVKNIEAETDWNNMMSSYYQNKNNYARALNYFKVYSSLKDSLNKETTSLKGTNIDQQLAGYERQSQIQSLKSNNQLQKVYLYSAIICVIFAVVIIFLIYRNWNISKMDVSAISELNRQINSQKDNLENTLTELKNSTQEKDRILRTVAHDLRNPVAGIAALTNVMALEGDYTEDQKELINLIKETSGNTLELINDILDVTDDIANQASKAKEPVELNALLTNIIELMRFKAAEKKQQIILEGSKKDLTIIIHREQIWRVLTNLISNAIKFSPEGGKIAVKLSSEGKKAQIAVADDGIGIPDEIKDNIFNIFTEAKRPGTAGEKSFGLGLSICKQIIDNHDGKIWFEKNGDKGTVFYISLDKS